MSSGLLVQEVNESLFGSGALVRDRFCRALREELDCWVAGDTLFFGESAGVLAFGVDLCDDNIGLEGEVISEGFPGRSQGFAICSIQLAIKAPKQTKENKRINIRPHQGAVKATSTSFSPPTVFAKL